MKLLRVKKSLEVIGVKKRMKFMSFKINLF